MTEPIPLWEDWRFWQIVVTGALAFFGFFLAAWAKYLFDLRLDAGRRAQEGAARDEEKAVLAIALRAELIALMDDVEVRLLTVDNLLKQPGPVIPANTAPLNMSDKPVYTSNTGRVGELGRSAALHVVTVHAYADHIRNNVAAVQAHPPEMIVGPADVEDFGTDFRQLLGLVAMAVNELCAFLGEPALYPDPTQVLAQVGSEVSTN